MVASVMAYYIDVLTRSYVMLSAED